MSMQGYRVKLLNIHKIAFDFSKNKLAYYRGKNCMKKFLKP